LAREHKRDKRWKTFPADVDALLFLHSHKVEGDCWIKAKSGHAMKAIEKDMQAGDLNEYDEY
jgi:hypothetical protein